MKTVFLPGCPSVALGVFLWSSFSLTISLHAQPDLNLTNLMLLPHGGIQLEARGNTGLVYSLQLSTDLQRWRTLDFVSAPDGHAMFQDISAPGLNTRFYRIRSDSPNHSVWTTNYHGWSNSFILSNGQVETAIVPAVGRIMQFRFSDQSDGPLWENPLMYGKKPSANSWDTTGSFGGDKVWPSPQSWPFPPPRGFDSLAYTGEVSSDGLTLTGPVDPTFGIRAVRQIAVHPNEPILRVTSTFEKVTGKTNRVGVWVVTQVKDAQRVFVPVPANTLFPKGYISLGLIPKGLVVTNGFVSLARDPVNGCKIGTDSGSALWVGTNVVMLIESPRQPGAAKLDYPDTGCSAEVYTNADPTKYIELELLRPLMAMGTNDTAQGTSVYTLFRRTEATPLGEAMKIWPAD